MNVIILVQGSAHVHTKHVRNATTVHSIHSKDQGSQVYSFQCLPLYEMQKTTKNIGDKLYVERRTKMGR